MSSKPDEMIKDISISTEKQVADNDTNFVDFKSTKNAVQMNLNILIDKLFKV